MPEKITQRMRGTNAKERDQLALLNATQKDLATLRTKFNALLTKLDADAGVTDTNYSATQAVPAQELQP